MILIIFLVILSILLIISRRKLGTFILAVFMGDHVNRLWNIDITNFITSLSLNIPRETLSGIAGLLLILMPAFLVLAKSDKYNKWIFGLISSFITAVFVAIICSSAISSIFILDEVSKHFFSIAEKNYNFIVLLASIMAIFEILSMRLKKSTEKS